MGRPLGLVLTGGGARGAYQAGAIKALSEISTSCKNDVCFEVLAGISAGSINATYCASVLDDFQTGVTNLCDLWSRLKPDEVYRSDLVSLSKISFSWISDLSVGALYKRKMVQCLLDTTPLRELLDSHIDYSKIEKNIDNGLLRALSCSSYSYKDMQTVSFIQGASDLEPWIRPRRKSEFCNLSTDHVMASSAVPILFPQISMGGNYFGDGSMRNTAPIGPAINLGARKLFVIGVRHRGFANPEEMMGVTPSIAKIFGLLLNSLFFDPIEVDIERVFHINKIIENFPEASRNELEYKHIDFFSLTPSRDIGEIAEKESKNFPKTIKYLLSGLGSRKEYSLLASYILFDSCFTEQLVEMGYKDCLRQKDQILEFLER